MRPILLIMWTAFQSFIPRDNNNNFIKNTILVFTCTVLSNENASNRGCRLPKKSFDRFQLRGLYERGCSSVVTV